MLVINQHMQMILHLIYPPEVGNTNWIEDEEYYKKRLYFILYFIKKKYLFFLFF